MNNIEKINNKTNLISLSTISIKKQLYKSFFEKFIKIIKDYNKYITNIIKSNRNLPDLIIPKIIIIGADYVGKSSLLENIIKCSIFKSDVHICSRLPICYKLNMNSYKLFKCQITYKNLTINIERFQIYDHIQNILNNISDTSFDEIIIEINDNNLPILEFYDLPGIIDYPIDKAEQTYKICEHYISQKNIIILCVIPATIINISSYSAIKLIKNHNKEQNTIICLTMSDHVQTEDLEKLIIKRINKTTTEYNSYKFAGCVAIMNKIYTNNNLIKNTDNEYEWFKNTILKYIPNDYPDKLIELIENNITINKLSNIINHIYNNFIEYITKPIITTILRNNLIIINNEIKILKIRPKIINREYLIKIYKDFSITIFKDIIEKIINVHFITFSFRFPFYKNLLDDFYKNIINIDYDIIYNEIYNTSDTFIINMIKRINLCLNYKYAHLSIIYIESFIKFLKIEINKIIEEFKLIIKWSIFSKTFICGDNGSIPYNNNSSTKECSIYNYNIYKKNNRNQHCLCSSQCGNIISILCNNIFIIINNYFDNDFIKLEEFIYLTEKINFIDEKTKLENEIYKVKETIFKLNLLSFYNFVIKY